MSKQQRIEVSLDADQLEELDRVAAEFGCSRQEAIVTAVLRLLNDEASIDELWRTLPEPPPQPGLEVLDDAADALRAFIQEGIDSADRGDLVDHKDVIAELRRRRRKDAA